MDTIKVESQRRDIKAHLIVDDGEDSKVYCNVVCLAGSLPKGVWHFNRISDRKLGALNILMLGKNEYYTGLDFDHAYGEQVKNFYSKTGEIVSKKLIIDSPYDNDQLVLWYYPTIRRETFEGGKVKVSFRW